MKSLFQSFRTNLMFLMIALALVIGSMLLNAPLPSLVSDAVAAPTAFSKATPMYSMPMYLGGAYTSTVTPVKFQMPYAGRLVGFSAVARSISGTLTVDLQSGGVSLLSAPISASTSVTEATVTTAAVASGATMTVVLTISGGGATMSDITVVPTFVR